MKERVGASRLLARAQVGDGQRISHEALQPAGIGRPIWLRVAFIQDRRLRADGFIVRAQSVIRADGRRPRKIWRCISAFIVTLLIQHRRAEPLVYAAQRLHIAVAAGRTRILRLHRRLARSELGREPCEYPAPFGELRVPADVGQGFLTGSSVSSAASAANFISPAFTWANAMATASGSVATRYSGSCGSSGRSPSQALAGAALDL